MTELEKRTDRVKKARSRVVRWFRQVINQTKPPYRWYDIDNRGM